MKQSPEIHGMLCLSTAHLTRFASDYLEKACEAMSVADSESGIPLNAYRKDVFGYFVAITDDVVDNPEIPESILSCMRYAVSHGADWLMFDSDGPIVRELPDYGRQ